MDEMKLYKMELLKWQQQVVIHISKMTDMELFDHIIDLSGGDEYDGQFSNRGHWEFYYCIDTFKSRLNDRI